MECNTGSGFIFDLGSLYAHFRTLTDRRKPRGQRYRLETVLTLMVPAKLCGEDRPSGIADWAQHRTAWLVEALALSYPRVPRHSTYRRIWAEVVAPEELDALVGDYLTQRKHFGRQVVVSIDGKILLGTLGGDGAGVHLVAAYLPAEGIVLLEMAVGRQENEIPVAAECCSAWTCGTRSSLAMPCTRNGRFRSRSSPPGATTSGLPKAISPNWKGTFVSGSSRMCP